MLAADAAGTPLGGPPLSHRLHDSSGYGIFELMVVVLILGVLAGLAFNTFLSRRGDALDRQAWSDLRNNAVVMESYFVDGSTYVDAPGDRGFVETVGVSVEVADATVNRFCLEADHEDIGEVGTVDWHYSNTVGSVNRGPCS